MYDRVQENLLASHAIWVGDYERAFDLYMQVLDSNTVLDALTAYKVNFELAVVSSIIGRHDIAESCIARLEDAFKHVEETDERIREITERSIGKMQSSIVRQFLRTKKFDYERLKDMLEYLPNEKGVLALFISPNYSRNTLKSAVKRAKSIQVPEVLEEGIFRFTLSSDLYRVVGKAYSGNELELERLLRLENLMVLIQNSNMYYVEDEGLRIVAGIQRDGLVLCHYLLQSSRDEAGPDRIRTFLHNTSEALSEQ